MCIRDSVGGDCVLEDLFTEDELNSNSDAIRKLNAEYSAIQDVYKRQVCL